MFGTIMDLCEARRGIVGALAMGWVGVSAAIVMSFPCTKLITFPAVSYLYRYFSECVVASRMRALERVEAVRRVRIGPEVTGSAISHPPDELARASEVGSIDVGHRQRRRAISFVGPIGMATQ